MKSIVIRGSKKAKGALSKKILEDLPEGVKLTSVSIHLQEPEKHSPAPEAELESRPESKPETESKVEPEPEPEPKSEANQNRPSIKGFFGAFGRCLWHNRCWLGWVFFLLAVIAFESILLLYQDTEAPEIQVETPKPTAEAPIEPETKIEYLVPQETLDELEKLREGKKGLETQVEELEAANESLVQENASLSSQIQVYPASPKIVGSIAYDEVMTMLRQIFPGNVVRGVVDMEYKLTTLNEVKRFLAEDKTNESIFIKPFYDNDDYAFRLLGQFSHCSEWSSIPFGWVKTSEGMFNVFIAVDEADNSTNLYGVDAETDRIWKIEYQCIIYVVI